MAASVSFTEDIAFSGLAVRVRASRVPVPNLITH
jgi:hypothetical protein